jgi:dinuclear metal center YbgI/SA1388 family protein
VVETPQTTTTGCGRRFPLPLAYRADVDLQPPDLATVLAVLDELYDPRDAAGWDAVGLVCGDPDQPVRRVLFAVDPVAAVVDEALSKGADLVVSHHPLLLTAVHGVPLADPRGAVVHRLLRAGSALFTAHTNADVASPGVSDALAAALGLVDLRPLQPLPGPALDGLTTYVPYEEASRLLDALAAAGAGAVGDYSRCAWQVRGEGTFLPGPGASPAVGAVGEVAQVDETLLQMVLPRGSRDRVLAALRAAHPYEMPAFQLVELAPEPGVKGLGRVGVLPEPTTLQAFVERVAAALPPTAWGVRATGDPRRPVRTVAVCGGSGGSAIEDARRAGVDAYVTADLRHHVASDAVADGGPALVDAAHWATEWPWLADAATRVRDMVAARGTNVECSVSRTCTDPWTIAHPETRPRSSADE